MKKACYWGSLILIFFSALIINSCDFESTERQTIPKVYIPIYMINYTNETILVYTGENILFLLLPSARILSGGRQSVSVEKGQAVTFRGETTKTNYGSRSFLFETQWEIH
jgi:hypothetical protein